MKKFLSGEGMLKRVKKRKTAEKSELRKMEDAIALAEYRYMNQLIVLSEKDYENYIG